MRTVLSTNAPKPVGPYAQAVISHNMVYCSGQLGIDPITGKLVTGGIEKEAEMVLNNLKNVLEAAGSSLNSVVKCTIYLTDMTKFSFVNEVYGRFFENNLPARTTVGVSCLPFDAKVEIDAIAEIRS
ncbi:MAG: RidA family protein [Methanomassiliicoccales archaeon]|nr:MAG: RidA family protein [Methanomassiliicoccales archaeon]